MDTKDLLQVKINEARTQLPQETRDAIDLVGWKTVVLGMNTRYSAEQLEELETETELLLCGLLGTQDYANELEARMHISKNEVETLINEMDRLIFKKIQEELEKKLAGKTEGYKPVAFATKSFALNTATNTPIQSSNTKTTYQKELYAIASEQKLSIEQMGKLEAVTDKIISGTIHPDSYTKMLEVDLGLAPDKAIELAGKVNEKILKSIRENLKNQTPAQTATTTEPDIPLPPYRNTIPKSPEMIAVAPEKKIFVDSGIEVMPDAPASVQSNLPTTENIAAKENNMMRKDGISIVETEIALPLPPITVDQAVEENTLYGIENPTTTATTMATVERTPDQNIAKTSTKDPYREPVE